MTAGRSIALLTPFLRLQRTRVARPWIRGMVLDVGCGIGFLADMVPPDRYLGVDINEKALLRARSEHSLHRFQSSLPPAEPLFDTVVALAVIEHVRDPARFLARLTQRLSMGRDSVIVCTTPHPAFDRLYGIGSRFGLFSRNAAEQHEALLDRNRLEEMARASGLEMVAYRRFLCGANQVAVFRRK